MASLILPLVTLYAFHRIYLKADDLRFVYAYGDPDYGYLFNSLMIVEGHTPWHIDHPGTPVQLVGALVMWVRHLLAGTEATVAADFIRHSLAYHRAMLLTAFSALFASQWFCGWRLLRQGIAWPAAMIAQAAPLFFFDSTVYLQHCSPETWIVAFSLALVPMITGGHAVAAGMLVALIVSLKIYSLPLVVLLLALPGPKQWLLAAASATFTFANVTAVIWPGYDRLFGWLWQLATHQGNYGTGPAGAPGLSTWITNVRTLHTSELEWLLYLLVALLPLLAAYTVRRRQAGTWRFGPELAAALVLLLLAIRHMPVPRYLLPLSAPLALVLVRATLLPQLPRLLFPLAGLAILGWLLPGHLQNAEAGRFEILKQTNAVERELREKYSGCALIFADAFPTEAFALFSGHLATKLGPWASQLNELYPQYFFPSLGSVYRNFTHHDWDERRLDEKLASFPCRAYVMDDPTESIVPSPAPRHKLPPSPHPLYKIKGSYSLLLYVETPRAGSVPAGTGGPLHRVIRQR